jgi:hypothetical protein
MTGWRKDRIPVRVTSRRAGGEGCGAPGGPAVTNLIIFGLAVLVAWIGYRVGYNEGYGDAVNGLPHG